MRPSRLLIALLGFLFAISIFATPGYMSGKFFSGAAAFDSPPVAGDDNYTKHGGGIIGPLLANDSDPDGDPISVSIVTFPSHGSLSGLDGNSFFYSLSNISYVGPDSFTYKACQPGGVICSNVATVNLTFVNEPPVGVNDTYQVHGSTNIGPMLANDSDPDGDPISFVFLTGASHGTVFGLPFPPFPNDVKSYGPNHGFTGIDTFTYKVCDSFQLCSPPVTVTLNVVNNPPTPGPDRYLVPPDGLIGPMLVNDSDPDGDSFNGPSLVVGASHGTVFGLANPPFPNDVKQYVPNTGFTGTDNFVYRICDFLGACADTTVTLRVPPKDDGTNSGATECASIGQPVNITNGNVWLQQSDYRLPAVGFAIDVTRTYNSKSQRIGPFGRGWASALDQEIVIFDSDFVRLNEADGRATYFDRPPGSSGNLTPLQGDFHGQLSSTGSGFTLTMVDGTVRQFNTSGKLVSLMDRNSNTTTLTYGANGFLSSVTDPFGRVLTVNSDANGRVLSITDTMGTIATYTYGGSGQLLSVTYADNSAYQFAYDGSLRLTTVTDALGNVLESHTYDGQGRALTSEKHGGVEHYTLSYVSNTQTNVTDALGRVTKYTIDKTKGRNVVTNVEGVCGCGPGGSQVQSMTYDSNLNLLSETDALGHVTSYTYDSNGNILTRTDPTGTATFTYNQLGQALTSTNQLNGLTTNTYDSLGNWLTTTDTLNNTTTFTYNSRGQLLTVTDARGKVTTLTYDANGNRTQAKDALNIITFYFWDARGRITKVRDGLSRSTLFAYDAAGRVNKITHPDLSFMTFTYDLAGRRTTVKDERSNSTNYAYDNAYRLTSITDAANQTISYGYDAMSNITSKTDALGRVADFEYDDFNRLKKITYPPATVGATRLFETIAYNKVGNVTQRIDTAGRATSYGYDNANRQTSLVDADNKTTTFGYDALSRLTSVLDPLSQNYQFGYDAMGRQTQITRGGVSMSYVYDAVGNRTQRTDYNGLVTNYTYDNLNRVTAITYPTRTVSFGYNVRNQVTQATNENGAVYISYDNRYRVKSLSDPFFYGITYDYDTVGNRTKISLNGATYATYTYDVVNRLTNLKDSTNLNFPYTYDTANRLVTRGAPNGVTATYTYDGLDRLTSLTHSAGAGVLIDNQYTYNDASNITSWTNASGNNSYAYDSVNRLTAATHSSQPGEAYSYDAVGNRTSSHLSATYSYQPFNKLISTSTASYTYDNNGNPLSKTDGSGTTTFGWDEENRLKQVTLPSGLVVNYKYDALGRRIQRTNSAGADERYVYDDINVLLDLNPDWSVAATYLNGRGVDNHLRQTSATTGVSYFLTDHLGTTSALADTSGALVESLTYDSFGNNSGSTRTRYTYTGRERDPDTGSLYYRARFYDPQLGRFLSEDPIGLAGGINGYAYAGNNPIAAIDPFGLASIIVLVSPRSDGFSGNAYILLLDKNGNRIDTCGCGHEYFTGIAIAGNPNRQLGNGVGDTPFGAYNFTGTQGGQANSQLGEGFGTGKVLLDGVFGEIIDSGRSLIRLHGGGSGLRRRGQDPYGPNHDLLPTQGCVRMQNADVNELIQAIKRLPPDDPLEFVFIGNSDYLHTMARDPGQVNSRWQPVLRTNLGLP